MLRSGILIVVLAYMVFPNTVIAETMKQKEQRESFQKHLEAKLYEVNQKLDRLRSKAGDVKEDSRKEYNLQMEELAKRQQLAGKKLADMKSASAGDWDRLKVETSFAIDDLDKMYDKILSLLKG